jgi:hypothetical protein
MFSILESGVCCVPGQAGGRAWLRRAHPTPSDGRAVQNFGGSRGGGRCPPQVSDGYPSRPRAGRIGREKARRLEARIQRRSVAGHQHFCRGARPQRVSFPCHGRAAGGSNYCVFKCLPCRTPRCVRPTARTEHPNTHKTTVVVCAPSVCVSAL